MYQQHFTLKQLPFSLTPDTEFFYPNPAHLEALDVLRVALAGGEGFIKVTGEVGTGKTLLCRMLLNSLDDSWRCAYVPNPILKPDALRRTIADELELPVKTRTTQHELVKMLNDHLLMMAANGKKIVICIDEAQALSDQSFEALRLLSNIETEKDKLVHIVLFGQPELDVRLAGSSLRQLRQRIVFSYQLQPMSIDAVREYLQHRLVVAGYRGDPIINEQAVRVVHQASSGIPRLVNIIAHKALMLAYGQGIYRIDNKLAQIAAEDTEGAVVIQSRQKLWWATVAVFIAGAAMLAIGMRGLS